ncbi:hypothetical protein ACWGTI_31150 [Mesorhizobium sp. ArgA1]
MSLTGTLGIDVTFVPNGRASVNFAPARKVPTDRLFAGLAPGEAADRMPLLFPLCSNAHAAVLLTAANMAEGRPCSAETDRIRSLLIAGEALREHSVRILNDWAVMQGREPDVAALRRVNDVFRHMQAVLSSRLVSQNAAMLDEDAAMRCAIALAVSATQAVFPQGAGVAGMGLNGAGGSVSQSIAAAMIRQAGEGPVDWGRPEQDDGTALGRHRHDPRVTGPEAKRRVLARLVEVEALCRFLDGRGANPLCLHAEKTGPQAARVSAEVARGRLVHEVEMRDGKIAAIQIGAPTSANFASGGAAETAIAALRTDDLARFDWLVRLIVLEVDPCVTHDVRVS